MKHKIRIVIADDEEIIRNGLEAFFISPDLGFEVVGIFENGQQTIEYIANNGADIVLTDVNMPHKSGLDVASYVHRNMPETHVVIISGYQEFKYAQSAIEYGVNSYLLKPVRIEHMYETFSKIAKEINREREVRNAAEREKEQYSILIPTLRQQFLQDLVYRKPGTEADLESDMEKMGFGNNATKKPFAVFGLKVISGDVPFEEIYPYGKARLWQAILNSLRDNTVLLFCEKSDAGNTSTFFAYQQNAASKEDLLYVLDEHINKVSASFKKVFNIPFFAVNLQGFDNISALQRYLVCEMDARTEMGSNDGREFAIEAGSDNAIQTALDYIQQNYKNDISLSEVADVVHLSMMYFGRLFKQETGKTFTDYLTYLRIEKAKQMIKSSSRKIFEVSKSVGYINDKYFTRIFKKITGMTPLEYRKHTKN